MRILSEGIRNTAKGTIFIDGRLLVVVLTSDFTEKTELLNHIKIFNENKKRENHKKVCKTQKKEVKDA